MDIGNGIKLWVTVRQDGDLPIVQVTAQKPYLNRTATGMAVVPETDPAHIAIQDAITDILERYTPLALYQAEVSAARSLVAAVDQMKEV